MDDRIKALLAARPDFNTEEFMARRILRHMGVVGKGVKAELDERELASPWRLACQLLVEKSRPHEDLSELGIFAMAEDDRASTLEHVAGLAEDNPAMVFVRGQNDSTSVFVTVTKSHLFRSPAFQPPMTLYPLPDALMVIMQKAMGSFLDGLLGQTQEDGP